MPFHFCPKCGTKLQPDFKFCPSCGDKIPSYSLDEFVPVSSTASLSLSPTKVNEPATSVLKRSHAASTDGAPTEVTARPALRKNRNSLRLEKEVPFTFKDANSPVVPSNTSFGDERIQGNSLGAASTPPRPHVTFKLSGEVEPTLEMSPSGVKSPRLNRGKAKVSSPVVNQKSSAVVVSSPSSSPPPKSPSRGKNKPKRAKLAFTLEPLQEGEEVTDTTGKKWKLVKMISQSPTEIIYEVLQTASRSSSKDSDHILKLGAKDGRIFNVQNFLQRAAKPTSVDKWMKVNRMDFLGIPACVGFGLHAESYRFLIFPDMGQCLQSIMEREADLLSLETVLQLACRILDVLQYIHSNEYAHADINAENIYIKPAQNSQVYLVGYYNAFRYCPGGQHVEYREDSRTPHEGATAFISLDTHKGAAPSRRSDLQSLGYCMLRWHTGTLPWIDITDPGQIATQKQRYLTDVPALLTHCFGKKKVPSVFQSYLTVVMALQYSEQPDYSALKGTLSDSLRELGRSLEQPLRF